MPATSTGTTGRRGTSDGDVPRRLVVELGAQAAADLAALVETEDLNKTTLVNKAIQLYAIIRKQEREGKSVVLKDRDQRETLLLML
jgi:hypothetical protein